jgi:hypothetical protein
MGDSDGGKHLYQLFYVAGCVLGIVSPPDPYMVLLAKYTPGNFEFYRDLLVQRVFSSVGQM